VDAPAPQQVIDGRYRLIERIGRGAMGDIWRVTPVDGGPTLALKLLHRGLLDNPELVARFEREIANTARIEHPNAVRIRGGGRSSTGHLYFVMDEIRGRALSAIAATEAPLDPVRVASIGRQIARALGAAHSVGVVHRDLKPENIMVERTPERRDHVVVFDFGLSIAKSDKSRSARLTAHDLRIGTPGYMAPEYVTEGIVNERTDLYALGVVLYELACGEMPFGGAPYRVFQQQVMHEAPSLEQRCGAPRWLSEAVGYLLRREPEQRPADAGVAVQLLKESFREPSPGSPAGRW
jgi:serine/threonine protein kinase